MDQESWISHFIVPCPKNVPPSCSGKTECCFHELEGQQTSQQHVFSTLITEGSMTTEKRSNMERRYRTEGMLFGDLDPVQYDRNIDPPFKSCFNCWSSEHKRKFCTEPFTGCYCCNCGRKGLKVDTCPRCSRAFQFVREDLKDWIYTTFYSDESNQTNDRRQMTQAKENTKGNEEQWDDYDQEDDYQYPCASPDEYGKKVEDKNKSYEIKDENFGGEPTKSYHSLTIDPNYLFTYMRQKKIIDEFESDKINNVSVNLDETRRADRDLFNENSIVSIDIPQKDVISCLNGDPINDMKILLKAVTYLPIETQNSIVLHVVHEPQMQMAIRNILLLIKSVGHLPVPTQIETLLQITSKRKQQMAENEMGFVNPSKSP